MTSTTGRGGETSATERSFATWNEAIALLPDREPATAQAWLCGQPQISVIARERGGGYALAAAKALPNAIPVADRWHLMEKERQSRLS